MADLLQRVVDAEWSGRSNTSCGCHPEYAACCPECDAHEHGDHTEMRRQEDGRRVPVMVKGGEHEAGCAYVALITETRAFLRAENEAIEARKDPDEEYLDVA